MALRPGCRFGLSQRGGLPRQCGQTVVANITIFDGKGRHPLPVCQAHYEHMANVTQGTEYVEDTRGIPAPVRVSLVKL